ncbi:MAG: helix-turn-helix transcriptional regulator [Alphaproteobacteria bacterium]|nr:helix-turn-helix transcriptional regulator [Alphaproteobacteria bacterium]
MLEIANTMKLMASATTLLWVGAVAFRGRFNALDGSWAVFCFALFCVLTEEVFSPALGNYAHLLGIAGGATCSVFWLVSRSLFRPNARIEWPHLALVFSIFLPGVIIRLMRFFEADAVMSEADFVASIDALRSCQVFFSSAALLMCFVEAGRGFQATQGAERHLRLMFMGAFGVCVTVCTVLPVRDAVTPDMAALLEAVCAVTILAVTSLAVRYRMIHPHPTPQTKTVRIAPPESTDEDRALGRRIEAALFEDRLFLQPDLKVADMARRLMEPEYKVSRAVTAGLGAANFNRLINRYRIEHARRLLETVSEGHRPILDIALDSGFALLGPFNRAFQEATGQTPRAYRNAQSALAGDFQAAAE